MILGVVGKPNAGKTTFFNAATASNAKVADYPFTTINPNFGTAFATQECVCREFNVKDDPRNSLCIDGIRHIPVKMIDVAGLVPDAWKGRGLGNKFLDDLRQADVLLHIVDASGAHDEEGRPLGRPGMYDPLKDVSFLEVEISRWMFQIISKDWNRFSRRVESERANLIDELTSKLSGLSIRLDHIKKALEKLDLNVDRPTTWSEEELFNFVKELRRIAKPILVVANKIDMPFAEENYKRMLEANINAIPAAALAELALIKYSEKGIIKYIRGSKTFEILEPNKLSGREKKLFDKIRELMEKWGGTGVQKAINKAIFEIGQMIAVYPVEDINKLSDKKGNILPDVFLVRRGTTARKFAGLIHSDLEKTFLYAIDARTKKKLAEDYQLKDRDVIKIVAAGARG
ncbi:MAG: redox-regulated ATPase YchF [Candidatus Korarchaeota archaeon]|nr:redox-regulated ATPase YchF [Candidatus Korarchaeota archaeon]